jgi:O-methyltransferase involved in polyketide biosynthesis
MSLIGDPWRAAELKSMIEASTTKASEARVYDYWLGGACNWAVDREFAEQATARYPDMPMIAQENRKFLYRAVAHLLRGGIRQFVDIGSGVPTAGNVHQITEREAPGQARVVYIDHDPIAHAHSTILLEEDGDPARHRALCVDLVDHKNLWRQVLATGVINPDEPVGLLMVAVLHFIKPNRRPEESVAFYRDQLVPGSGLVVSHGCGESLSPEQLAAAEKVRASYEESATNAGWFRSRSEIAGFFGDWSIVDPPGLTWTATWTDGVMPTDFEGDPARAFILSGVAHKPA